jgi:hypothetical protein
MNPDKTKKKLTPEGSGTPFMKSLEKTNPFA